MEKIKKIIKENIIPNGLPALATLIIIGMARTLVSEELNTTLLLCYLGGLLHVSLANKIKAKLK